MPDTECLNCVIEFASDKPQASEERLKVYDGDKFVGVKYPERTKQEPEEPLLA
jgi:hypothetical protein